MIPCGPIQNDHASLVVAVPKALPIAMRAKFREVVNVRTTPEHRGQGHAKALLQTLCERCDENHTWLIIHVKPSDDSTTMQGLVDLYGHFGFTPFQSEPLLMFRPSAKAFQS